MRRFTALAFALLLSIPALAPVTAAGPKTDGSAPGAGPIAMPSASADQTPSASPEPTSVAEPDPTTATPTPPDPSAAITLPAATAKPALPKRDDRPNAAGRYIVVLKNSADTAAVIDRHRQREGTRPDRRYKAAFRGFAGHLDATQRRALLADPNVVTVVPDETIQLAAQVYPTGISRVYARSSSVAAINGIDERVDADIAIVDTGVGPHPDLNVVGGRNCSTSDPNAWRDQHGHGTHVAGTAAALDNTIGVVGVAPGARIWAVRILNSSGSGLLSWYVCGLDWILAQRDPNDPSRPLIEAVNMSVAKSGRDDGNCGLTNKDVLHQAICRLYRAGITVVAAAANAHTSAAYYVPAAYNEVITVSALADTDGRPGGLGGHRCYSWGGYDVDDTFADFSNYGSDIDLIAPGKCIRSTKIGPTYGYMSGTSMATPHVAGAVALYKASRPGATPREVRESLRYLGNLGWRYWTDPDSIHEPLLDLRRLGTLGSFSIGTGGGTAQISSHGGTASVPVIVTRSASFFERVRFNIQDVPSGWSVSLAATSLFGWTANSTTARVTVPTSARPGTYHFTIVGSNWGRVKSTTVTVEVSNDLPTASAPTASVLSASTLGRSSTGAMSVTLRTSWAAATDPSDAIVRYEIERSTNGGAWSDTRATSGSVRSTSFSSLAFGVSYRFRVRAQDSDGDWSPWATSSFAVTPALVSDRSTLVTYRGRWSRYASTSATNGGITSSSQAGATARYQFTGRTIAIVAPTSATRGRATVYIDGAYKTTIDLRTSTIIPRRIVYVGNWSAVGMHTIELRVAGTSGRPTVSLDGFVVLQ
ncbi:MAG TPA: S8 family serine peptidase [Candidatus Limnocylindrales bacterium]|jgi:subtilisin family serine protease|nr:S8 family serine peptidase [Candidatus Limnocylindrales bacterium]